jgi:hypothetical protein
MRNMLFILFLVLTFIGPAYLIASGQIDFFGDYRTANRDSAHLAPDPATYHDAVVQIYKARAFDWHGLVSMHTWIATKEANAPHYIVHHVVGWRKFRGLTPLMIGPDVPDRNWFAQKPSLLFDVRGGAAAKLIPVIEAAARAYPYPNDYTLWPGPNSNTFTAFVMRQTPQLKIEMPANAIGKDFLNGGKIWAPAVSHTGYQFSFLGIAGLTLAKEEGLEINFLGLVYGFNPLKLSIKLPCIGEISLLKPFPQAGEKTDSPL